MTTKTADLDILNSLISAGLKREEAEKLASEILTRDEAYKTLVTKADLSALKFDITKSINDATFKMAGLIVTLQTIVFIAVRFL